MCRPSGTNSRRFLNETAVKKRRTTLQYETELSWFILVSVLDIVMTFLILRYSAEGRTRNAMIEGNPVARWILHSYGVGGMAIFKLLVTAVVCVIAEIVGRHRPVVGRNLLRFGTLVVGGVVVYSFLLLKDNMHIPGIQRILDLIS